MKSFLVKLRSTKLLVCIWCMALVSYVIITNKTDMINLVMPLSFAPLVYSGLNVAQKKIEKGAANEEAQ